MRTKEQEEQIEIRRLNTENRLLRQRLEALEKENMSLADKLIQVWWGCDWRMIVFVQSAVAKKTSCNDWFSW